MRCVYASAVALVAAAVALAAPPVELPSEVKGDVGDFIPLRAKTPGKVVHFVPLDPGLKLFPADLLTDKRATVVSAGKAGRYRVLAYSSVKDDPTEPAVVTVVVGGVSPVPPGPEPKPPVPPEPKPPESTSYYFLVVRADGPADPAFTKVMGLPAWGDLRAKGHRVKDKTVTDADKDVSLKLPEGTPLPCVVTLSVAGGNSKVVRYSPMPASDAEILKLAEGLK